MNSMSGNTAGASVLVWDLPTRVFHWLFAASFAVAWLTHESSRLLDVHVFAGYLFAALLVFRLVWGIVGSRYARFRSFVWSWRDARAYLVDALRGRARRFLGHNPAGSWAIYAMLALGVAVAATGIGVLGGEERHGPLAGLLSFRTGAVLHEAHELAAIAMLLLVLGHLAGVVVESAVHRENLIAAMVSGLKRGRAPAARRYRAVGIALLVAALLGAAASFSGYLFASPGRPYLPFTGPQLADNATWRAECGGCHLAYHPVLLPARSGEGLMTGQADHFGDDLAELQRRAAGRVFFVAVVPLDDFYVCIAVFQRAGRNGGEPHRQVHRHAHAGRPENLEGHRRPVPASPDRCRHRRLSGRRRPLQPYR